MDSTVRLLRKALKTLQSGGVSSNKTSIAYPANIGKIVTFRGKKLKVCGVVGFYVMEDFTVCSPSEVFIPRGIVKGKRTGGHRAEKKD